MQFIVLFRLLLGIVLLAAGRRLFWLFLGIVGFVFAFDLAEQTIRGQSQDVILVIALCAGMLGAMAAVFLQKFAVVGGGFFAGGYLLTEVLKVLGVRAGDYHWLIFIGGGLAGAFLMRAVFGWALILLSSFIGAVLVLQTFHFGQHLSNLLLVCLALAGIIIQSGFVGKRSRP